MGITFFMPHKIALFAPPSPFYRMMLSGLSKGFTDLGHTCVWQTKLPPHDVVASFAQQNGISLVIEINRALPRDQSWPSGVGHAAWLQDHWIDGNLVVDLGKSDIIYFLYHPDASYGGEVPTDRRWSILSPGARSDAPAPTAAAERYDLAFCGHLPSPVGKDATVANRTDGSAVTLEAFVEGWPPELLSQSRFCLRAIRQQVDRRCEQLGCEMIMEQRLVFDETLVRTFERRHILTAALELSSNVGIWGPNKWQKWPEFAPFYKGDLPPLALDQEVYQASRLNIHTGIVTMHVRSMDCMAAGGASCLSIRRRWTIRSGASIVSSLRASILAAMPWTTSAKLRTATSATPHLAHGLLPRDVVPFSRRTPGPTAHSRFSKIFHENAARTRVLK